MKKSTSRRIALPFFIIPLFILSSCSDNQEQNQPSSIIGDQEILAELGNIVELSQMDENQMVPLMAMDLDMLNQSVASDPIASHYLEELYYMLENNGSDHIAHTVDFLGEYLQTGKKQACAPHELWHATLYIKNDDFDLIAHAVDDASEMLPIWVSESRDKQKKYPQFYLRLDGQIAEAEYLIEQLYQKNYSSGMVERLSYLGETSSC
jgi:hypothetical protein